MTDRDTYLARLGRELRADALLDALAVARRHLVAAEATRDAKRRHPVLSIDPVARRLRRSGPRWRRARWRRR
jgi:hypothetical protein